ncbi:hypothetical protein ABPG74_019473 [Tetrahymena malaccensis]
MRSFKQHISENILDKLAIQIQKLSHKITINPNEAYLALTQTQKVEVLKQPRLIFDRKNNELSQIQKQKLINLALQENKLKKQKNIFKIKYHKNQDDRKRILGGGACCSSQRPIEGELKIQKIEPKDGQNRPINKDFERIYNSKVINKKYTSEIVQKEVQYQETKDLFEKCLNRFRKEVIVNINSYRTHIVDIFNLCLLYIISGAQTIDRDDQNEIITKTNVFLDQIRQNIKLFACLDVEFIYSFFADLNDDNLDSAQINQLQQVILFAKKQIEEKIEANEKKELISGVQELAFNKSDQLQYVWQIIDRAREKVKAFTKYNIICQISALLAQKYEKFGQFHDISPYDEMIFYVEKCIEFTQKQSSSYFILYILVQINYLLEKIIQNGKLADITILMRDKLTADLVFQQFMKMLKQQSTQQQQSESFFQFFKFTVKDITYRFLSDAILLKLYSILQFEKISEVDQLWTHLVYTYTTEKNESVKLVFQNNDVFVRRVNQDLETNSTEIGESVVNYQEKRKQVLRANKINNDEIDQLEDTIKDQNDFVDKVNVRLIEKWELEARQRSERDNLQKDNIIQEDYDLYVDQNLSYICGNQIFNQIYSKGSAVDQIITQFLIPNQNDENRGSFRDNFECKSFSIVKLKEFETKDIKQYCTKFFNKEKAKNQISFTQEEFLNIINSCLQNKLIEGLLRLPINLYLFTIMTIGKTQSEINELIKGISDQISLLEVFYGEQFNREAVDFMKQISSDLSDKSLKNEIVSSYFNYFQIISIQMFGNKGIISNFTQLKKDEIQFQLQQQIKNMISPEDQIKLQDKIDIITNRLIVSAVQSLFLINPDNFEVEATYKFPSQIETISIYNDKCAVLLKNSFKYVGNLQTGFKKLDIQGQGAILFKEQLITYHQGQLEIYDIKQNSILINSIQSQEFTRGVIDKQGKYLVTIQDKQICLWNFEQLKLIQDMNEHTGQINHASISPDGRFFATASDDQICFLFQLESNKLSLICTINDHQYSMSTANFSQDSQLLITASYKNVCKIRKIDKDSQSPQVIHSVQGEISSIQSLSYSKNGNNLATISQDGNINIWSYEKGYQQVKQLSTNCANSNTIIISKDDKYLISHSNTGVCKVWNIKKDYELLKTIEIEKGIKFIALSQDSKYLAIGCNDKSLQILNVQSSFKLEKALQLEDKKNKEEFGIFIPVADFLAPDKAVDNEEDDGYCVQSAAFSPDGNYLVVGVKNQGIKIFDINNDFKELLSLESGNCVCFSESGKYLASSSNDATFKIWNVQNNFVMIKNIKEHAKQIKSLAFSPNNKYLATGLDDNTCKIWNIEKNFQLINSISSHTLSFKAVAFSSDSKHLATSFEDCTFKVWNLENGSELIQNKQGHSDKIFSIIVSNNGRYLITSSLDKTIKIWDIQNDFKLVNSIQQSLNEMLSVALTPDDKFLISGLSDGQINVWNVNENFELYLTLQLHLNRIISLQTTQKYLLSYSSNEGCKLWDFNQKFDFLGSSQDRAVGAACIKLSPDGRYLATSNKSNQGSNVTIWDVEDNFQAVKTIQDHTEFVSVVNFSPQNKYLITGSNDTTCKIWNINSNFKLVQTIKDHTDKIILASFSLDNKYLVTSSESSCKIWNVERNFQLIKNIQEGFLSAAFTGDGQYLVLGNLDSRCQVLKIEKQKGLISKLTGNNEDAEEINKLEDVFYLEKEL